MGNNVLWAGYRTGCYMGGTQFVGASDAFYASCFGKLKPNTTYTIVKLDASSRLRIGVGASDMSGVFVITNGAYTQSFDKTSDPINAPLTFTTSASEQYITVYYTNTSETNIRVMLNEGSTALPYEPPTEPMPYSWIITGGVNNNYPLVDNGPLPVEVSLTAPYPKWAWIIDTSLSDGYPHIEGLATAYIMPDNQFLDSWGLAVLWGRILELLANKADIAYADAGIAGMMLLHEQILLLLLDKANITYVDAEIDLLSNKTVLVNSSTEIETNQLWLDGKTIWRKVFEVPDAELDEALATQIPMGLEDPETLTSLQVTMEAGAPTEQSIINIGSYWASDFAAGSPAIRTECRDGNFMIYKQGINSTDYKNLRLTVEFTKTDAVAG